MRKSKLANRDLPEVRAHAVRMVFEHQGSAVEFMRTLIESFLNAINLELCLENRRDNRIDSCKHCIANMWLFNNAIVV